MSLSLTLEAAVVQGMGAGVVPVTVTEAANRAVVFIDTRSPSGKGSGTLTSLPLLGDSRALLLTCNHVIPDIKTAKGCYVSIDRYNDSRPGMTFSGENLFDFSMFKTDTTNVPRLGKLLDFTIIGVKMDVLRARLPGGPPQPLPMTDYQSMKEQLKVKDQISVIHFPQSPPGFQRCSNTLNIIKEEGPIFGHSATTYGGSSGCPIFREFQERWVLVGLHRGGLSQGSVACTNLATHISAVYDAYMDRPYKGPVPDLTNFRNEGSNESSAEEGAHTSTDGSGGHTTSPFSASEFLKTYEDEFIRVVDAKQSLLKLKHKKVISDKVKAKIEAADEEDAKFTLLEHLQKNATVDTLRVYCDVAIAADGYAKMQALGKKMKEALPSGGPDGQAVWKAGMKRSQGPELDPTKPPSAAATEHSGSLKNPKQPRLDEAETMKESQETEPLSAEYVLNLFREQFLKDVDAKAVVDDLKHNGIVPQDCQEKVSKADGYRHRNVTLHDYLKRTCTREALMKACDIIIGLAGGNPQMKKVAEDMKMKLETGK